MIVGAGLAGLAAARALVAEGASVVVLEARERVGGRLEGIPVDGDAVVELGGQWIGPTQERVAALARSLGVETFPTYNRGENVIELQSGVRRYRGTVPRLGPLVLLDVAWALRKLDRLMKTVPLEAPWRAPRALEWDSQTLWSWMRRNVRTRTARELVEVAAGTVWGAHSSELSLLHALFYMRSGGGFERLLDVEGGAQQDRFVGGSHLLAQRAAAELGDAVVLAAPVRRLERDAAGVAVHGDGVAVRARRAIVAVPPPLAARIAYDPPLDGRRDQLTQRMVHGALLKCAAVYDEPFWRADGLTGQATSTIGPVRITFDNSPPSGAPGVIAGFVDGAEAHDLARLGAEERQRIVTDCLARMFGDRARRPERYLDRSWADEEWSRGGPVCSPGTGGWTGYGPALREPAGPVHWAGAETATVWCGYMDGAISSGERAAREVLAALA